MMQSLNYVSRKTRETLLQLHKNVSASHSGSTALTDYGADRVLVYPLRQVSHSKYPSPAHVQHIFSSKFFTEYKDEPSLA